MYPSIYELGPVTLHSYGLMIALGFITILFFMQRDARRVGVDPNAISDTAFWTLIIGVASTRLTHIIMFPEHYSWTDPIGWINVTRGGLVFQGAIPTAMIFIYWSMRRRKISFLVVADIVLPYVPIAQAFGRMGCFLKGCCFGARADDLPWAVCFPEGSPAFSAHQHDYANFPAAGWSYPVHPTQLYSIALLLCISGLLLFFRSRRSFIGICLPFYFVFYAIKRFIVEMYRGDGNPEHQFLGVDLTTQQIFCVAMMAFGLATWYLMYRFRDRSADPAFPEHQKKKRHEPWTARRVPVYFARGGRAWSLGQWGSRPGGPLWRFAQVSDPHLASQRDGVWNNKFLCTMMPGVMDCLARDLAVLKPDFLLVTGDIASTQTREAMLEARDSMESLHVPYYPMGGNHDFVVEDSRAWFLEAFLHRLPVPRTYYAFTHKNLRFCILDAWWMWSDGTLCEVSEASVAKYLDTTLKGARWAIPPHQLTWLADELRQHPDVTTAIAVHYPAVPIPERLHRPDFNNGGCLENGVLLLECLAKYPQVKAIFSGHVHLNFVETYNGITQVVTGALPEFPTEYRDIRVFEDRMEIQTLGLSDPEFARRSLIPGKNWTAGDCQDRHVVIHF